MDLHHPSCHVAFRQVFAEATDVIEARYKDLLEEFDAVSRHVPLEDVGESGVEQESSYSVYGRSFFDQAQSRKTLCDTSIGGPRFPQILLDLTR